MIRPDWSLAHRLAVWTAANRRAIDAYTREHSVGKTICVEPDCHNRRDGKHHRCKIHKRVKRS